MYPDPSIEFDPEGMSGSPVFGMRIDNLTPEVFLAGMLTNYSRNLFHFMSRVQLSYLLEAAFNET